ncbi:MarR family winged helix-turn-helix transcriptional regulator [Rubrobacter calidifluminis]|uniref:MarR family winged helix-turn-helix transcriptional regulator n=1 Tax=Rubrobacter calidifluminis TaxID=1392640 RepID=UPI0023614A67|nr:MarR family transcriptional regulator [Rubrobacter calidifluminis]
MAGDTEDRDAVLIREAEEVTAHVHALPRLLRRSFEPDIARSGLTAPQIRALDELTREDGISLKELSSRMELSHSTVSGIVDRLEQKGFLWRTPDPKDRRYSCIFLSEEVKDYLRTEMPFRRRDPILRALALASPEERSQVLQGIRALRRLLEMSITAGDQQVEPEPAWGTEE